jgi:hypothetical protein
MRTIPVRSARQKRRWGKRAERFSAGARTDARSVAELRGLGRVTVGGERHCGGRAGPGARTRRQQALTGGQRQKGERSRGGTGVPYES